MNLDISHFNILDDIIAKVEACGGTNVTIAGGAVRDSVLEKPIKDIDVFYEGELVPEAVAKVFGEKIEEKSSKDIPPYPDTKDFKTDEGTDWEKYYAAADKWDKEWGEVADYLNEKNLDVQTYKGERFSLENLDVQLIGVPDTMEHIASFPCYISRMFYTEGSLVIPKEAIHDISLQVLRFTDDCSEKYKAKIEEKYEDYL